MISDGAATKGADLGPLCLVTGGAGFLGQALTRELLARGLRVRSYDRRPLDGPLAADPRVEVAQGDLRDRTSVRQAVAGCSTVFHTAAVMEFLGVCRQKIRDEVFSINLDGTRHVLEACQENGVPRLVYTSTNTVCYANRGVDGGDESRPYAQRPLGVYAQSKIAAESLVLGANGQTTRTVAIRPAGIWGAGPGCYMIEKFVRALTAGQLKMTIGNGRALSDNTHVANVVSAELLAAEQLVTSPEHVGGQAYFVTDEEPMNLMAWFRPLIEGLGYTLPRFSVPAGPLYVVAHAAEWVHRFGGPRPFLTRLEIHNLTTTFTFRTDKARRELGYHPLVQHEAGMAECLAYLRAGKLAA